MHNHKIKIAITTLLFVFILHGYSQNNSSSTPYSRYGIGELSSFSLGSNMGMANIGMGIRNPVQVNYLNPASYSSIDTTTFLFEVGLNYKFSDIKSNEGTVSKNDFNFSYLNIAFPVSKKWGMALGLHPYSQRGYDISGINTDSFNNRINYNYNGDGTISKAYLGNSVELFKGFSIGVNSYFLFGKTTNKGNIINLDDPNQYITTNEETFEIHDFGFQFGAQYTHITKNKNELTLGVTYSNKEDHTTYSSSMLSRILSIENSGALIDTISHQERTKGTISTPQSYGAGLSYRIPDKLTVGFDYYQEKWKDINISDFHQNANFEQVKLQNRNRYSAGAEFIPRKYSVSHYYERVQYRLGAFYEQSNLNFRNESINNYGMTFGLGLPIRNGTSLINISWEIGNRGTTSNNLVSEKYSQITLHFMLFDRWFLKRKYD